MSQLVTIITATDPAHYNRALDDFCTRATLAELLAECAALDRFRRSSANLYQQVRALFFLYAIYRFHLPDKLDRNRHEAIPFAGYTHLLGRRFEEAIDLFLAAQHAHGPSDGLASALAAAYHRLGFQTLANQVRRSVRAVRGNQWMFRIGHPADQPLRVRPALFARQSAAAPLFPILCEATPVRADLTHSGWSDIFFLGMDYPAGARVLNISVDLAVRDADHQSPSGAGPKPPIECYFRVIDQPMIRLVSVDLGAAAEVTTLAELFDFGKDYTGLLKAALIAAGLVPPGMEGADQPLADLLGRLIAPGYGIELVSQVNGIPKGSRLAVSTNLLASLIAVCMRATEQIQALTGPLTEEDRRLVAARAILGEWLGGSGGGWQDSGGIWPGIKLIHGVEAGPGDPEHGVSRGRLLPDHHILSESEVSPATRQALQQSLVMVHGGMAQDVGPILEMVTEKYLLRAAAEWEGRQQATKIIDEIMPSEAGIWINPAITKSPVKYDLARMFVLNLYGSIFAENKVLLVFNGRTNDVPKLMDYLRDNRLFGDEPTIKEGTNFTEFTIKLDTMNKTLPLAKARYDLAALGATHIETIPLDSSIPGLDVLDF
ncbi:MAG: hypothetical protein KJZ93_15750 [Caldilineaceae bacterium]|nr:hypothetical protein [Caldilineaceae bacterium]